MSLLDLASLSNVLEERLGVTADMSAMAGMQMAPGGGGAGAGAAAEAEAVEEQTEFAVTLESFDAKGKIKLIKELRAVVEGLGMKDAKDMVDNCPKLVKSGVAKEVAEEIKGKLEAVGGKVSIK